MGIERKAAEGIAGSMEATDITAAGASPFEPSLWDDFFVTYTAPTPQRSEEWMRERANQLKNEVKRMFGAHNVTSVANTLTLVDALERLGIDHHFHDEIDKALCRLHHGELEFGTSDELHVDALRFRLLRQHGFFVSTDIVDKYRDGTGTFSMGLASDPRGLLSLYNAAHMAVPGEDVFDEEISFTRPHLTAVKGNLGSPLSEQISRALDIPLPRYMQPLESTHYITEYEKEEMHNNTLLELARLDYNITRSLHLKELRTFCIWDESASSILPEYLRAFYIKTLSIFDEFENILEPDKKYRVSYARNAYILLSKCYFEEVKWCNEDYIPSFKDQLDLSCMSSTIPAMTLAALMAAGDEATMEAVEWASNVPDMVLASGEIARLLNDISAYKSSPRWWSLHGGGSTRRSWRLIEH